MNVAKRFSDSIAVLAAIDPDAMAAGEVSTPWINASDFASFAAIIMVGALGASAAVDAKIGQATDSAGTGVKDLTGKAITQITANDGQAIIDFKAVELDLEGDYTHFRLTLTVGAATSDVAALVLGADARYEPASDHDAASVVEIV